MKLPKSLTKVTPFSKALALSLFIILPILGFYLGMQYQKGLDGVDNLFIIKPVTQNVTLSLADNNKIRYVHVGDTLVIATSNNQQWNIQSSNPAIIQKIGTENRFRVIKAGTVTLGGTGTARCQQGHPCPLFAILFKTTIIAK